MTCSAVKAKGAGLGNKWILILHPSLPLTPLNLMLLRKANPTKTRAGRVEDTRDIADPASKEESFNFHYADHMYIPLHPSCLRGAQTYRSSFRTVFSEAHLVLFFDFLLQKDR
jgi:hypothetical protein